MTARVSSLAQKSLIYALGGLAYKGVAVVSVPLLARLLDPAELGLLDLAAVIASICGIVIGLGADQAVAYFESRTAQQGRLWASALAIVTGATAVVAAAVIILREPISAVVTGDPGNADVVVAAAIYAPGIALTAAALNATRLRGTPRGYAIGSFAIVSAEMLAALTVAFLVEDPVPMMVLGWAIASVTLSGLLLYRHLPRLERPDRATVVGLVRFGLPLVPATIAWLVGDGVIRSTIARDASLADVGEFGIAHRIVSVLSILVTGFAVAWQPYLYRTSTDEITARTREGAPIVVALVGMAAVGLALLAPEIISVVSGPRYAEASVAIAPLAGGMVAYGLFTALGPLVAVRSGTGRIAVAAVLGVLVQVATSLLLVATMGITGAAVASTVGYVTAAVVLVVWLRAIALDRPGQALIGASVGVGVSLVIANSLIAAPLLLRTTLALGAGTVGIIIARQLRGPLTR